MTCGFISSKGITLSCALGAVLAVAVASNPPRQAFAQTKVYVLTELTRDDGNQVPLKLNNSGQIAGRTHNAAEGGDRATIWNQSGSNSKHLGSVLGGNYSSASAINDAGDVAGASNTNAGIVPFFWTTTGGLQHIPLFPGDSCGQANGINKNGHVVGYSSGPNGSKAFLWTRKTGLLDLGVLSGGNFSRACDVNDSDEVAGTSASSSGKRAVLWTTAGKMRDLGVLPGDSESEATAINNAGDVVGYSKGAAGMRAFLWTKAAGMQNLGVLPGGTSSQAFAINDSLEVVGSSTSSAGDRAFIWTRQTGLEDLNNASSVNLGVVFIEAHSINSKGEILAMGKVSDAMGSLDHQLCAPTLPSSFVLTPEGSR